MAEPNDPISDLFGEEDRLSKKELAQSYGWAFQVLKSVPELWQIFRRAFDAKDGQWTVDKFKLEIQNTDWWEENSRFAREAWAKKKIGGKDWEVDVESAALSVAERAAAFGVELSEEEIADLAERSIFSGWLQGNRIGLLDRELAKRQPSQPDLVAGLRQMAADYGLKLEDSWFQSAASSVTGRQSTRETWEQKIRDKAKSKYRPLADRIDAGESTRDAMGEYIAAMRETWELPEGQIDLDDPMLKQAIFNKDEQGNDSLMSVYDFETKLRQDPRWKQTGNGRRETMNLAESFLKSMGFVR